MRIRFHISLVSHVGSRPEMRRETKRPRCADVAAGESSPLGARSTPGRDRHRGWYDQNVRLPVTPMLVNPRPSLSHLERASERPSPASAALSTTTTDHFVSRCLSRWEQPRYADVRRASRTIARGEPSLSGRCHREGLGDRLGLPTPHHPSRSRSHEEGNVDQRIATGGMPHRDR